MAQHLADDVLAIRDPVDAEHLRFADVPRRAVWSFRGLATGDGHVVDGSLRFGLSVATHAADRQMVIEVLMPGRSVLRVADAIEHFQRILLSTTGEHLAQTAGELAVGQAGREALLTVLRATGERAAFACGLEFLGPFDLKLDSPSLAAQAHRQRERAQTEADAQRRAEHLRHAAALAETVAKSTNPTALLAHTSPNDQPAALAAILMAGAARSPGRKLFAAAGGVVLQVDPVAGFAIATLAPTGDIGPIRSVQRVTIGGEDVILAGGQRGVATVASPANTVYIDPAATSRLGFNAVAYLTAADEIWATHSQRGLVRWRRGEGHHPVAAQSLPADSSGNIGAQDLVAIDATMMTFSSGARVYVANAAECNAVYTGGTDVVGLIADGPRLHVVHADGAWVQLETGTWRRLNHQATGGPVSIATGLPWAGGVRLLLARRDGGIDCFGVDDALVTRYASRHVGVRGLTASESHVAAMTADRQRLILWHTADGREPIKEIHVASIAGSRVAGIGFG